MAKDEKVAAPATQAASASTKSPQTEAPGPTAARPADAAPQATHAGAVKTESAQEAVKTEAVPIKTESDPTKTESGPIKTETAAQAVKTEPSKTSEPVAAQSPAEGFIPELGEVLASTKSRSNGGAKIRANVGYTLVPDGVQKLAGKNVPEQEAVILKILNKALTKAKPLISEPDLNKLIVAAHASKELKSKQDPWHIFRYYRTDLIKQGALRQIDMPNP